MKMNTYVNFAGKCAEAFRFYEQHLGGKIGMMMTHGEAPDQSRVKPGVEGRGAARAHLDRRHRTDGRGHPERSADAQRLPVARRVNSDAEAERIFSALSDGGEVFMPMEETFFATRFGQLRDRFGINWMILHERPTPSKPSRSRIN